MPKSKRQRDGEARQRAICDSLDGMAPRVNKLTAAEAAAFDKMVEEFWTLRAGLEASAVEVDRLHELEVIREVIAREET